MAIKEILDRITANLGEVSPEVKTLIADAKREVDDILDSKSASDRESKSRKEKIRELESQVEALKADASKAQSPEAQAELKRLKDIETKYIASVTEQEAKIKAAWQEKSKVLAADKTNKLYSKVEKVLGRFIMPKEGTELTIDEIRKNMETMELLESTGYFTTETLDTGGKAPISGEQPVSAGDRILALSKKPIT